MRRTFEFECTSCRKYFDFKLSTELNGNYRIHCPNCGHIHYRKVENGDITQVRWDQNDKDILIEDIRPMKSSCRDFRKEVAEDSFAATTLSSFFRRRWQETPA